MITKAVFITGIANGVGAAIARQCLREGAAVYGCDKDAPALKRFKDSNASRQLHIYECDITDIQHLTDIFDDACADSGGLDGLVNNAGIYLGLPIEQYDNQKLHNVVSTNLISPMKLSLMFAEHVRARGGTGSIVNVASVAGEVGSSDAVYGAVKAGVIGLTKSNAMNFAPDIRVNVVSPGLIVDTEIAGKIPGYRYDEYKRQEMLDRDLTSTNVADVISFLLGEKSASITGAILRSDNGCYPR